MTRCIYKTDNQNFPLIKSSRGEITFLKQKFFVVKNSVSISNSQSVTTFISPTTKSMCIDYTPQWNIFQYSQQLFPIK